MLSKDGACRPVFEKTQICRKFLKVKTEIEYWIFSPIRILSIRINPKPIRLKVSEYKKSSDVCTVCTVQLFVQLTVCTIKLKS